MVRVRILLLNLLTSLAFLGVAVLVITARNDDVTDSPYYQNVIYWGQNRGSTVENNDLLTYCALSAGIDIIVLAFLYK